jgi:hypothetical protein
VLVKSGPGIDGSAPRDDGPQGVRISAVPLAA